MNIKLKFVIYFVHFESYHDIKEINEPFYYHKDKADSSKIKYTCQEKLFLI